MPNLTPPIASLLEILLNRLQDRLGPDLVGLYLRGSLASGDFEPDRSDVDLLAVTEQVVNKPLFGILKALHDQVARLENPYAQRLEIAYIDRAGLRKFQPGQQYPTLGQGEALTWQEHGSNWLMERWVLREQGIPVYGPDPRTLVDPIHPAEIQAAAAERLQDWADWARDESDPDWQLPRSHKAYAVETICRVLYTLKHGELASKRDAVDWGIQTIPEPWKHLICRSQAWRWDATLDPSLVPEVRAFILWAADQGRRKHGEYTQGEGVKG